MFGTLSERLQATFQKLRGRGKLTEKDVDVALREVRLALLEADVNFKVVKDFLAKVRERAVGQEVLGSLSPAQQVIKIVNEELTALMGGENKKLDLSGKPPVVVLMAGLQGSGKTTFTGKLARFLKSQGKRPLMVAGDVYRPAAVQQLQILGEQVGVPVFERGTDVSPVQIAKEALAHAERHGNDVVLFDTAGRLHVDDELMEEISRLKETLSPKEILLVVDAMTGQDAVNVAESFHSRLGVTGVVLTKMDGDARGGAALSVRAVTGAPVKFAGVGEKLDELEPFHPDRIASRILGMGDVLSLIEKAEAAFDAEKSQRMVDKLTRGDDFTLEDFREQMEQVRNMGPIDQLIGMIPGVGSKLSNLKVDDRQIARVEAMINSMTVEERRRPDIIDGSRRRRIAAGSGTKVQDVNRLLKQFDQTRVLMKQFMGPKGKKRAKRTALGNLFGGS